MVERTLVLIKPDGVQRGIVGDCLSRFERAGLKIVGLKMVWISREQARQHYKAHIGKPFYDPLEAFITSGPVVALALEGVDAIENVRKLVGATEPKAAAPGTIRGDLAHVSAAWASAHKKSVFNVVHASSSKEEAKAELELWFKPEELHSYRKPLDEFLQ